MLESRMLAREIMKQDDSYSVTYRRLIELASRPGLNININRMTFLKDKNDFYRLEAQLTNVLAALKTNPDSVKKEGQVTDDSDN